MTSFPTPSEEEHLALDIADDDASDAEELAEANATLDGFLERCMRALAPPLLDAVEVALHGGLETPAGAVAVRRWIATVRERTATTPVGLVGVSFARELFAAFVGTEPQGPIAHRVTVQATPTIDDPAFAGLSRAIEGWLRDAYPDVQREGLSPLPRSLRRFRLAVVWPADRATKAAALAAEHPGLLPVAAMLVERHDDPDAALSAFDEGLARAVGSSRPDPGRAPDDPADDIPGPKRTFTRYHLGFAVIIALLTLWHYVLR